MIDRCNLTTLFEPRMDLAQFLAKRDVEIDASLPCYSERNVDEQRGRGVFGKSIAALRLLNDLGYGTGPHTLNLVYMSFIHSLRDHGITCSMSRRGNCARRPRIAGKVAQTR